MSAQPETGSPRAVRDNGEMQLACPVSIKGVVVQHGTVLLLHNERDEWELPGGKLGLGETPEGCLVREVTEEVGWHVQVGPILDAWLYHIREERDVLIVTYGCSTDATGPPGLSDEHSASRLFGESEIVGLNMPEGYKRSISEWFSLLRGEVGSSPPAV
jgi:8-oxo-dGTP pyrophosphatase MutT (NUDIX family)